jgi:hypothetical protein
VAGIVKDYIGCNRQKPGKHRKNNGKASESSGQNTFDADAYIITPAGFFALTLMPDDVKFTFNRRMVDCFVMILFAY